MRVFLAIELPGRLRGRIADRLAELKREFPPARWVKPENIHLTLVFLGEVAPPAIAEIDSAMTELFAVHRPFDLGVSKFGSFPPESGEGVKICAELMQEIAEIPGRPRQYHPHLTVGRIKRPWSRDQTARWQGQAVEGLIEPFPVRNGTLFRSRLTPDGPLYSALSQYSLELR